MKIIEVAIVGAGPAGAYCAYNLAENGIYPTVFDHSHPREKPCGGLISPLAQEFFPFLREIPIEHVRKTRIYVVPPSGRRIFINLRKGYALCISRLEFDRFLLNMALEKGAKWIREKVVDLKQKNKLWEIKTEKSVYFAEKLVGADGVNSIVRSKVTMPLKDTDKAICYGYFVENMDSEEIFFYYLPHRKGYVWIIPRRRNTSIGIGCSEKTFSRNLDKELDIFIKKHNPNIKIISKWAALIPNIKEVKTLQRPTVGSTWILIGDAAGHVNPVSGEGIFYALLSGKFAARALAEGDILLYEELWRHAYGLNLLLGIKFRKWVYTKPFLECYCRYLKIRNFLE